MASFATFLSLVLLLKTFAPSQAQTSNEQERLSEAFAYLAYPTVFDGILVDRLETPVQFRALLYLNLANFNAWANFHPTAADIFGRTRFKQPAATRTTKNKNIACLYALLRVYEASPQSFGGPSGLPSFRKLLSDRGLDPDDRSMDTATVIGIGNREGTDTARLMSIDGWNAAGDLTSTADLYKLPFQDYIGYSPVNTPWELKFPFRWQPLLETDGLGFFFRQEHVTPYAGRGIAFSMTPRDVRRRKVASPFLRPNASGKKLLKKDLVKLRKHAKGVFKVSRQLTERQRLLAELFDNKVSAFRTDENPLGVASIGPAVRFFVLGPGLDFNLDEEIIYGLGANIASFDAMVAVWNEKLRHDAVRPTGQAMEFLFGQEKFTVAGKPYGPSVRIKAGEWQPYIRAMPHSEFPSASSCACSALIEHALTVTKGRDVFPYNVTFPKGSSRYFPGEFPRENITVAIDRLSEWSTLCGMSRLWAGVHFEPAIDAGVKLCKGIGTNAQEVVNTLLAGRVDENWMSWLPRGTDRFWEWD